MPIFQPTNISPSTFDGISGGTIAVADNVVISWNVNGNSALTSFDLAITHNDADSTAVWSNSITLTDPFYGTNAKGEPQLFTYAPGVTWASLGLLDGGEYKLKITQHWDNATDAAHTVVQNSESAFVTRTAPSLSISAFADPVITVQKAFSATFTQAQGDVVNWVRWVLTNTTTGETVDDTQEINTSLLAYTADGLLTDNDYTISCTVETSAGVTVTAQEDFSVSYSAGSADGSIVLSCTDDEGILLSWSTAVSIPGTATGTYTLQDGKINLPAGSSVTWDEVDGETMDFSAPYSAVWKGDLAAAIQTVKYTNGFSASDGLAVAVDKTNNQVAVAGGSGGLCLMKIYNITSSGLSQAQSLVFPGGGVIDVQFGVNGNDRIIVAVVQESPYFWLFKYENGAYENGGIPQDAGSFLSAPSGVEIFNTVFNGTDSFGLLFPGVYGPGIGAYLYDYSIIDGYQRLNDVSLFSSADIGYTSVCTVGTDYLMFGTVNGSVHLYNLSDDGNIPIIDYNSTFASGLGGQVNSISANGNLYAVTGNFTNRAMLYYSTDPEVGYTASAQIKDTDGNTFGGSVNASAFSADGSMLALGGAFSELCLVYTVDSVNHTVSVISAIPGMSHAVNSVDFAANGNLYAGSIGSFWGVAFDFSTFVLFSVEQNTVSKGFSGLTLARSGNTVSEIAIPATAASAVVGLTSAAFTAVFFDSVGNYISTATAAPAAQGTVSSVSIFGAQTSEYMFVTGDPEYDLTQNDYTPALVGEAYMLADYNGSLDAGSFSSGASSGNVIYRQSGTKAIRVATVPTSVTKMKDYGLKSLAKYQYSLYYVSNGAYSTPAVSDQICKRLVAYSLIEATVDPDDVNVFHVLKVWRFGNNASGGSVSNNYSPQFLENFTRYPSLQYSTQMPLSGTLTGLLSNTKNNVYADTAEQMQALFEITASRNQFFLKDRKGNLYMIAISGAISQTVDDNAAILPVSVSVPWQETGDASEISLIQLPTDPGWKKNGVLSVRLYVDSATGILYADYPDEYVGTTFSVVGNQLVADTPDDVQAASFVLADGVLTATV